MWAARLHRVRGSLSRFRSRRSKLTFLQRLDACGYPPLHSEPLGAHSRIWMIRNCYSSLESEALRNRCLGTAMMGAAQRTDWIFLRKLRRLENRGPFEDGSVYLKGKVLAGVDTKCGLSTRVAISNFENVNKPLIDIRNSVIRFIEPGLCLFGYLVWRVEAIVCFFAFGLEFEKQSAI